MMGISKPRGTEAVLEILDLINNSEKYEKKIRDFENARIEAEKAFNELEIGNDAARAKEEAEQMRDEAQIILNDAKSQSSKLLKETNDNINQAIQAANDKLAFAQKRLDDLNAKIGIQEKALKKAQDAQSQAESEASRLISEAQTKLAEAESLKATFQDKIDKIRAIA